MSSQDQGWRQANFTDQPLTIDDIVGAAAIVLLVLWIASGVF